MTRAESPAFSKAEIRAESLRRRNELAAGTRQAYSRIICERIMSQAAFVQAKTILGYLNFGTEVDIEAVLRAALEFEKKLILPRVNRESAMLDLYQVKDIDAEHHLVTGVWGIREPSPFHCESGVLSDVDFVLVPGVAFDRQGGRIGYGKGFYDKLLGACESAGHRPVKVAAAFDCQMWERVPMSAHDVPVDVVVTESE